ncbi:MAG: hypothetical protein GY795_44565 [Desulfobacterales bacterium]|nr:hypothetical protein [Desulfobacterales bacterium]
MRIYNILNYKLFTGRIGIIGLSAACFLPPLLLFLLVTKYWVNIPYLDQWYLSTIFGKYYSGSLSFSDLIVQHNESRKVFPKLLFLFTGLITGWDVRVEMCFTLILACLTSLNLFILLRRIGEISIIEKLGLLLIINILFFSTVQYNNWLWGIQLVVYIPAFLLTTGLIINMSDRPLKIKLACNAILSTISTYSYANGMLLWVLLFPFNTLFDKSFENVEKKSVSRLYCVLYFIFFLLITGLYFNDYQKPAHHPQLTVIFSRMADAVRYFLIWIGSPFSPFELSGNMPYYIATCTGGLFIILFVSTIVYNLLQKIDKRQISCFYPWFIIGSYSVISGIVTTVGRLGFAVIQAASGRYIAFSIFFPISIVVLVYLTYVFHIRNRRCAVVRIFKIVQASVLLIILTLHTIVYVVYISGMDYYKWWMNNGKIALRFSEVVQDEAKLKILWHDPKDLLSKFSELIQYGLLDFKPVKSDQLKWVNDHRIGGVPHGFLETCLLMPNGKLLVRGWAWSKKKGIPADNVIITYTDEGGNPEPIAVTLVCEERPDVEKIFKSPSFLYCGFSDSINISGIPPGKRTISAWTVDTEANIVYKLGRNFVLSKEPS